MVKSQLQYNLQNYIMPDNKNLSLVTLVMPTYERHAFLKRTLDYYKSSQVTIIVCDGSTGKFKFDNQSNVEYYHLPQLTFQARMDFALCQVRTPYAAWLGDDEIQLESGLLESILLLEKDEKVSNANGRCFNFGIRKQKLYFREVYKYKCIRHDKHLFHRIESYFLHYNPTIDYGVWRIDSMKRSWRMATSKTSDVNVSHELYNALGGLIEGQHIIHDKFQWMRSEENVSIPISTSKNKEEFTEIVKDDSFMDYLAKFISINFTLNQEDALNCIKLMNASYDYFVRNRKLLYKTNVMDKKEYPQRSESAATLKEKFSQTNQELELNKFIRHMLKYTLLNS